MNYELKNFIDEFIEFCESINLDGEQAKTDFVNYILYLSTSDGRIDTAETEFLKDYFDIIITPGEALKWIDDYNISSPDFENRVPQTMVELVGFENRFISAGGKAEGSISYHYHDLIGYVGHEFLACDEEVSEEEVEDMRAYLEMIDAYWHENCMKAHDLTIPLKVKSIEVEWDMPDFDKKEDDEKSMDELLEELNGLIGLEAVKKDVNSLIHLQEIKRLRRERGLKDIPVSNHLVFYGNPGTGKTTVARLLAKIYHSMGILSSGAFVEVDRSGLVAGYIGQTAIKVQEVVNSAKGGVLFIDEAYSLVYSGSDNDFGREAIDALIKAMEDNRDDLIVIVAGYPEPMEKFINSNPGLRSRFNKYINFEDYNPDELLEIYKVMCKNAGYISTDEVLEYVGMVFEEKYKNRDENFANAREVRNFFETAMLNQADRLFGIENPTDEELCTLILDDVS